MTDDQPRPEHSTRALTVLVFAGGICTLGSEIAAARLLAPYFGDSTIIWANTIGVVLVALSVGYWYGGKLADRRPDERSLRLVVLAAAVLLAIVPLLANPFFDAVVGAFDDLDAGAFLGSLVGVLIMLAIPLVMLGTISPWALRLALKDTEHGGEIAGRLYAVSTLGSLLGTFLSALVLIPLVGTQRTFIFFAASLALVAASGLKDRRSLVVPALLAAGLALPIGLTKPAPDGERVLAERDTTYQYARVTEREETGKRYLELNEGQAVHSIWDPDSVLVGGPWDAMLTAPLGVLDGPPRRTAVLGNAAGTIARAYGRFFPEAKIDGVEIDGELSDLGRTYFGMGENPNLQVYDEDARPFLRRSEERYDVVAVDAYHQPYIPFYLATVEFFELVRDRLTAGGTMLVNVGHPEGQDGLEKTLTRTIREVFPHVRRYAVRDTSTILTASSSRPSTPERMRAAVVDPELRPLTSAAADGLQPPLAGGSVYTDDKAPVEWLVDTSLVKYATEGGDGE